ncbi:RNA polymerase sigma factor [Kineococcus gypseus]|uniref:RNA polymerase sigma factor n=1 Tax=Kineococcus gypseus TaxID=1637102 RepID=UPI003D7CF6F7
MAALRIGVDDVEVVFRAEHGRALSVLIRLLGDIDAAGEAVQDAFATAVQRWPLTGLPPSPAGWIITTARHRAVDRHRRDSTRAQRHAEAALLHAPDEPPEPVEEGAVRDERLRLAFTCCHPALSTAAQAALTLRLLGGLSTPQIARAFLVPDATMAQRIVRAKKIREAGIPYRVPRQAELPARLRGVLAVLYLIHTEGHSASSGQELVRTELCAEAVRLTRSLAELMPDEPEVLGLLGLLLLSESRRGARTGIGGALVPLGGQDRSTWDRASIEQGQDVVRSCLRRARPGPYQLRAAIAAVHADARTAQETDWAQVLALYDHLLALVPTPIVALNRAVALAEVEGPAEALAVIEGLDLPDYPPRHAVRADLLRRLGRREQALHAYDEAITTAGNDAQRAYLTRRRTELQS